MDRLRTPMPCSMSSSTSFLPSIKVIGAAPVAKAAFWVPLLNWDVVMIVPRTALNR